jgi:hypothetical protein
LNSPADVPGLVTGVVGTLTADDVELTDLESEAGFEEDSACGVPLFLQELRPKHINNAKVVSKAVILMDLNALFFSG